MATIPPVGRKIVSEVVTGLQTGQAPKLIQNIAKQLDIPINSRTLKTGIVDEYLVGMDHTNRFIATQGYKLKNGNFGTQSNYGYLEPKLYSSLIPESNAQTERDFCLALINKSGLNFNVGRTKTGVVNGNPFAIEYDTGRFLTATKESLTNEGWRTTSQIGRIEAFNLSKEVPKNELLSFTIKPKASNG